MRYTYVVRYTTTYEILDPSNLHFLRYRVYKLGDTNMPSKWQLPEHTHQGCVIGVFIITPHCIHTHASMNTKFHSGIIATEKCMKFHNYNSNPVFSKMPRLCFTLIINGVSSVEVTSVIHAFNIIPELLD